MRRLFALTASLMLSTPALATDDALDLFALVFAGLADGAAGQLTGSGPIERLAPGSYRGTPVDGTEFGFVVTLTAPCNFEAVSGLGGSKSPPIRVDLDAVTGFRLAPLAGDRYRLHLDGPAGLAQMQVADGRWLTVANVTEYETSVPLAELEAGMAALRRLCPGPDRLARNPA